MSEMTGQEELTDSVRRLLGDVFQQADFPGSEELARQAMSSSVVGGPITMLEIRSDRTLGAAAFADGPIPLSMEVSNSAGDLIGELLVWVENGYLSGLEFAWWTVDPPNELPLADRVNVTRK